MDKSSTSGSSCPAITGRDSYLHHSNNLSAEFKFIQRQRLYVVVFIKCLHRLLAASTKVEEIQE